MSTIPLFEAIDVYSSRTAISFANRRCRPNIRYDTEENTQHTNLLHMAARRLDRHKTI